MTELQRNFWLTLAGRSVSRMGGAFNFLALSLMIFAQTGSAMSVGQVMVAANLPMLLLGPVAGVWVDRLEKRKLAIICEILRGALVLMIPFAPNLMTITVLAFLAAAVGFFSNTAQNSLIPQIFPKEELLTYNSRVQMGVQIAGIVGPILAGIVVSMWSYTAAFVIDSMTFFLSALTLMFLSLAKREAAPQAGERPKFWAELREGARYLWKQPRVLNAMAIMFTAMALSGLFNVLFIVFSKDIIQVTDKQFGWLEAGIGVGLALGAAMLNFLKKADPLAFVRVGMILDALLIAVMGAWVFSFWTELIVVVGFGVMTVMAMIGSSTIIQTETEEAYIGRVFSFYDTLFTAGTVGSMALAGVVATWFDVRDIFLYGGLATAAGIALLSLKRLPKGGEAPTAEEAQASTTA